MKERTYAAMWRKNGIPVILYSLSKIVKNFNTIEYSEGTSGVPEVPHVQDAQMDHEFVWNINALIHGEFLIVRDQGADNLFDNRNG